MAYRTRRLYTIYNFIYIIYYSIAYLYYACLPVDRPGIYNGCVFEYRCCPGPVSRFLGWGIWEAVRRCRRQLWSGPNPPVWKEPPWPPPASALHHCPAKSQLGIVLVWRGNWRGQTSLWCFPLCVKEFGGDADILIIVLNGMVLLLQLRTPNPYHWKIWRYRPVTFGH